MEIFKRFPAGKAYKFGCVITVYNRSQLLNDTLRSISASFLPKDLLFVFVDDSSIEPIAFEGFGHDHILIKKTKNSGVAHSLLIGWDFVFLMKIPFMLNLDSDLLLSHNWMSQLVFTFNSFKRTDPRECIATGFNGSNHLVSKDCENFLLKESIGGANLFFSRNTYSIVRNSLTALKNIPTTETEWLGSEDKFQKSSPIPSKHLENIAQKKGIGATQAMNGWDWQLVALCHSRNVALISTKPSVVEHVGVTGLTSSEKKFEKSNDFSQPLHSVPKIIHQTWKTKEIPSHLRPMQESVIHNNPDFEYMFWTDEDIKRFITTNYPNILNFYNSYEYVIEQIDFARLLIVYHFGGIYIDLDTYCFKPLFSILDFPVTMIKTDKNSQFEEFNFVLTNAFFAAERKNDFIAFCLKKALEFKSQNIPLFRNMHPAHSKVLASAGPLLLTNAFFEYEFPSFINFKTHHFFFGTEKDPQQAAKEKALDIFNCIKECHMVHVHESSWWKDSDGAAKVPELNKHWRAVLKRKMKRFFKLTSLSYLAKSL